MFNQQSNKTIEFKCEHGEAFGNQVRSETHVSSSGGGGYVHQGSGHVSAPTISSRVVTKQNFWLHSSDGRQIPIQLTDADIPLADGQKLSLAYARPEAAADSELLLLVNHSAGRHWFPGNTTKLAVANIEPIRFWPFAVIIALIMVAGSFNSTNVGILAAAFFVYRIFRRWRLIKAAQKRLDGHLEGIAQSLYKNPALASLPALAPQ